MPADSLYNRWKKQVCSQYRGFCEIFSCYWRSYGGLNSLLASPYLHLAFLVNILTYPRWIVQDWQSDVIDVIPNLLGFSLGGYAILLALGSAPFIKLIVESDVPEHQSYCMLVNVSFLHFIVVQITAMVLALLGDLAYSIGMGAVFAFLSYWIFIYAFFAALAATIAIFRLARVYNRYARSRDQKD